MIELELEERNGDLRNNKAFIVNFQTGILLSLLENKQLTKWQFDLCMEELQK